MLFIGANDNGSCANLPITDELLLTLADMRSDGNILPFPSMTVQKRTVTGCEVAVIESCLCTPRRFVSTVESGFAWGRDVRRPTADEERRLAEKRRAGDLPFDHALFWGATIADLDLDLFQRTYLPSAIAADVLAENVRSVPQQLASLHFLTPDGVPNVAAILTLGKDSRNGSPAPMCNSFVMTVLK